MTSRKQTFPLATLLAIAVMSGTSAAQQAEVVVIANHSVPQDSITSRQLLDLYTGDRRTWSGGLPVTVFDLKEKGDVRRTFYRFIGKSPSRMKSIWMKRMLLGEGQPPKAIESEEELLRVVASTPGAIAFAGKSKVNSDVKTLITIEPRKK